MKRLSLLVILSILTLFSVGQVVLRTVDIIANRNPIDSVYGIDVSSYQGKIDFTKIDSSIKFCIIKASEGSKRLDTRFKYNWDNCKLPKGGYHFFRPQSSGILQAKLFLSQLSSLDSGNIKPVIDVEHTPYWNLKKHQKIGVNNLKQMIEYIKGKTGIDPIIYTSGYFWNSYIAPHYDVNTHTLWVVDYMNKQPKTPTNMKWVIWQFTCKSKITGVKTKVDKNICLSMEDILID